MEGHMVPQNEAKRRLCKIEAGVSHGWKGRVREAGMDTVIHTGVGGTLLFVE